MRLGVFGGTFDPVHLGHLILAEQCREQCELDEVWFIPTSNPPHKNSAELSDGKYRAEMLELATAGYPQFVVSRIELERHGTTFTLDTLRQLHNEDSSRELFLLIGADSLADLPTWREAGRIAQLSTIVVVNRGDRPLSDLAALESQLSAKVVSQIQNVTMPGIDISATDIRTRIQSGKSIRFLVPRSVEAYITEHKLYAQ